MAIRDPFPEDNPSDLSEHWTIYTHAIVESLGWATTALIVLPVLAVIFRALKLRG